VDIQAKKISGSTASYPSGAPRLKSGDAVSVSVTFVVDANGDVDDVKVVESAGAAIDDSVVKAIRKWKYSPALKQGVKVKVKIAFKQTFRAG
jgi:TonB family protein